MRQQTMKKTGIAAAALALLAAPAVLSAQTATADVTASARVEAMSTLLSGGPIHLSPALSPARIASVGTVAVWWSVPEFVLMRLFRRDSRETITRIGN